MKLKEKLKDYIVKIIREESEELKNKEYLLEENVRNLNALMEGYGGLVENVRNLNALMEGYSGLVENVRNLNALMEGYSGLVENVRNLNASMEGYSGLVENVRNLNASMEGYSGLVENVRNLNASMEGYCELVENVRNLNSTFEKLGSTLEMQKVKIAMLEKIKNVQYGSQAHCLEKDEKAEYERVMPKEDVYLGIDYFDFENHFRGSMQHIRETQDIYVKYFKGSKNVVDLGCGRGEFLELLKENNIDAQGVDFYEEFVEMCKQKGLKVTCADAISFLKTQQKVGGIFAAQLIEHLSTNQLVALCELAYEKLEEGACIIMETPNPQSLSTYTNAFYMDPSHSKPVHPLTVQYILQKAGFKKIEIIYTETSRPQVTIPSIGLEHRGEFDHAMKQIENMLFGSQDYAVIAKR